MRKFKVLRYFDKAFPYSSVCFILSSRCIRKIAIMNASRVQPCIRDVSKEELNDIIDKAKDWALMHGVSMRSKGNFNKNQVEIAPFTLLPSTFPKNNFKRVKKVQTLLNEIMHKVAYDNDFITNNLRSTIEADAFTAKLFNIYQTVYAEGFNQNISVGLLRSDYMLHGVRGDEIKQIELNTIASSFAGISTIISKYHRYILTELGELDKLKSIPENKALTGFCNGLVHAWSLYNDNNAVILFIVEDITYNICDQRLHEFEIRRLNPQIKIIRRSLTNLAHEACLGDSKELKVGNLTVAVAYYRSGYQLEAYPTESEWSARLLIERSRAIKCPSIQYHLAGTKKVQQSLAHPGALNKYLSDFHSVQKVQEVFAGLYSLDFDEDGEKSISMGIREPSKYVLKPQREGGGNNVYGESVKTQLNFMKDSKERTGWILMDRIYPPVQTNYLIRSNADSNIGNIMDVISELGIYGVIIGDSTQIIHNEEVGHVLRTKPATENEGGIVQGVGALDSPFLVP